MYVTSRNPFRYRGGERGEGVAHSGGKGEPPWDTFFQGTQILVPEKCAKGSHFLKGLAIKNCVKTFLKTFKKFL